jgi:hypothetical protein
VRSKKPDVAAELELTWAATTRAAEVLGVDVAYLEPFQLLRYQPGEFYKAHHDHAGYYDPNGYPDRPKTMLLFLNDVAKGALLCSALAVCSQLDEGKLTPASPSHSP